MNPEELESLFTVDHLASTTKASPQQELPVPSSEDNYTVEDWQEGGKAFQVLDALWDNLDEEISNDCQEMESFMAACFDFIICFATEREDSLSKDAKQESNPVFEKAAGIYKTALDKVIEDATSWHVTTELLGKHGRYIPTYQELASKFGGTDFEGALMIVASRMTIKLAHACETWIEQAKERGGDDVDEWVSSFKETRELMEEVWNLFDVASGLLADDPDDPDEPEQLPPTPQKAAVVPKQPSPTPQMVAAVSQQPSPTPVTRVQESPSVTSEEVEELKSKLELAQVRTGVASVIGVIAVGAAAILSIFSVHLSGELRKMERAGGGEPSYAPQEMVEVEVPPQDYYQLKSEIEELKIRLKNRDATIDRLVDGRSPGQ